MILITSYVNVVINVGDIHYKIDILRNRQWAHKPNWVSCSRCSYLYKFGMYLMSCSAYLNTQHVYVFLCHYHAGIYCFVWNHYGINWLAHWGLSKFSFWTYFLPKCISYKKIVIHIKIEIFLLLHLRKVCFGKGGGLVSKGNKSLPWPMETQLTNAHVRPQASMS